jgi:hypothetical protein
MMLFIHFVKSIFIVLSAVIFGRANFCLAKPLHEIERAFILYSAHESRPNFSSAEYMAVENIDLLPETLAGMRFTLWRPFLNRVTAIK